MAVTERLWCDYIICTPKESHVEKIYFDTEFVEDMTQKKAVQFWKSIIAPEYFEMRTSRHLIPFTLDAL